MTRSLIVLIATLAAGCAANQQDSTIVSDISYVGHQLDVETCTIKAEDSSKLVDCTHKRISLPVIAVPESTVKPSPSSIVFTVERAQVAAQLSAARPALEKCGTRKALEIQIEVNGDGVVTAVTPDTTDEGVRDCITNALEIMQFKLPRAAFTFTFKANKP